MFWRPFDNPVLERRKYREPGRWVGILKRVVLHPVRLVPLAYLCAIAVGTLLLMIPAARTEQTGEGFMPALFTSVSALCVTGLITVDTPANLRRRLYGRRVVFHLRQAGADLAQQLAVQRFRVVGLFSCWHERQSIVAK